MLKTNINHATDIKESSAIEFVQWPPRSALSEEDEAKRVFAVQTSRVSPHNAISDQASAYHGFNLGLHVGDCAEQVESNRQSLQNLLPHNAKIQWLEQVHGNNVAQICQVSEKAIVADAVITDKKNICLAIMTADCLPILLVSKSSDEIAAIHGGWRPLAKNIIANTLDKMKTPASGIQAWLGPCISNHAFEVGSEVKTAFTQQSECFNAAFAEKTNGKYFASLHEIAKRQLNRLGIDQISILSECTYSNTDKYYSYRKNKTTGRMATLICLL